MNHRPIFCLLGTLVLAACGQSPADENTEINRGLSGGGTEAGGTGGTETAGTGGTGGTETAGTGGTGGTETAGTGGTGGTEAGGTGGTETAGTGGTEAGGTGGTETAGTGGTETAGTGGTGGTGGTETAGTGGTETAGTGGTANRRRCRTYATAGNVSGSITGTYTCSFIAETLAHQCDFSTTVWNDWQHVLYYASVEDFVHEAEVFGYDTFIGVWRSVDGMSLQYEYDEEGRALKATGTINTVFGEWDELLRPVLGTVDWAGCFYSTLTVGRRNWGPSGMPVRVTSRG